MEEVRSFLRKQAEGDLLPWKQQVFASTFFGLTIGQVEKIALELGFLPSRYQRNRNTISVSDQLRIFKTHVAVIGCGGLGGYIVEELTRLGIGHITAVDPDVFEEHNLNRQLYSSPEMLGKPKVEAAQKRVTEINPAVTLTPLKCAFSTLNGVDILQNVDIVVDALDSITVRLELSDICSEAKIPLVHGAIGGWYGQVSTQFPGEDTLQKIYSRATNGKGVEKGLGNPSFTPAVIASLQVAEVCKIIIGQGSTLAKRKLHINLLDMEIIEIQY
ncbi:MAG: HesA/MoeB/ThiF family protein [Geobacteraceae bacterium]|nr:HesA/MoeB/ThiF family protein [Geobacteraceae bacterium]